MLLCSGKTCSDIKSYSSQAVGASYVIDPDGEGGYEPFTVYCDMTDKNEVGVTVDSESRTVNLERWSMAMTARALMSVMFTTSRLA